MEKTLLKIDHLVVPNFRKPHETSIFDYICKVLQKSFDSPEKEMVEF